MLNEDSMIAPIERLRVLIRGAVQGVGFRPFVYRLAQDLGLAGWVSNGSDGVHIEVEGPVAQLERFLMRLEAERPPHAVIQSLEPSYLEAVGYERFEIRASVGGVKTTLVLPDIATCPECLREILDPSNRRYRYPFTNCTHCGPRYSIIEDLPYDRRRTTMKVFRMCPACQAEYDDPLDRRFHAQPNACPACGPQLELWDPQGNRLAFGDSALRTAVDALTEGSIVAVKGLGGFQLWVDASRETSVQALRARKHRKEKPFAVMVPTLAWAEKLCEVSALERRLLAAPESPIVLLRRRAAPDTARLVAESVAPGNPALGVMLPYTPLHHLLLHDFPFPVVATSGNLSEEPICIDEQQALRDLGALADVFLVHNRPIVRPVDDSVAMIVKGRELLLRRARGYAPMPIELSEPAPKILAVGGHLKSTVAVAIDRHVFLSQHLGDLETVRGIETFQSAIESLEKLYEFQPDELACDLHPGYASTRYAQRVGKPVNAVQHHYAHVLSVIADNDLTSPVLGVAWDGSGWGIDETAWGGEFLRVDAQGFERVAHLRTFRLPGGERAVREPRRTALGLLYEIFGEETFARPALRAVASFSPSELPLLHAMLSKNLQSPVTSSMGRLFDVVASLVGLRQITSFEGQAAMELEYSAAISTSAARYPFSLRKSSGPIVLHWEPLVKAVLDDVEAGVSAQDIAAKFHNTLPEMIVAVAREVGEARVVLSGGCFQNRLLIERTITLLQEEGFKPFWAQRIPPNDGGIALGQVVAACRAKERKVLNDVSGRPRQDYAHFG
jgi:hydrogenase maturation protein HypF